MTARPMIDEQRLRRRAVACERRSAGTAVPRATRPGNARNLKWHAKSVSVSTVMKRVMRQRIVLIQRRMREVARKLVLAKALTLLSVGTARTGRWWSGQKMKKVSKEWDNDR